MTWLGLGLPAGSALFILSLTGNSYCVNFTMGILYLLRVRMNYMITINRS